MSIGNEEALCRAFDIIHLFAYLSSPVSKDAFLTPLKFSSLLCIACSKLAVFKWYPFAKKNNKKNKCCIFLNLVTIFSPGNREGRFLETMLM